MAEDELTPASTFEERLAAFERRMAALGHPVVATSKRRTAEDQAKLFAQGRSAPGKIVTEKSGRPGEESRHQSGMATDFAFLGNNGVPDFSETQPWDILGQEARGVGLEWGGDWTTLKDRPHVQMPAQAQFTKGGPAQGYLTTGPRVTMEQRAPFGTPPPETQPMQGPFTMPRPVPMASHSSGSAPTEQTPMAEQGSGGDDDGIIIVDDNGDEHEFPAGFDPKLAASIVKNGPTDVGSRLQAMSRGRPGSLVNTALDALPAVGATLGGIGAAPFGAPLGPGGVVAAGALGAGAGAAGGEGVRQTINQARKYFLGAPMENVDAPVSMDDAVTGMGKEALGQGAAEVMFGHAAPALLKWAGKGLYRAAAGPINSVLSKYGDVVGAGIGNRVPISEAGYAQAQALNVGRKAEKAGALAAADKTAEDTWQYHNLPGLVRETQDALAPHASASIASGLGDPSKAWQARSNRILDSNYWPALPSEVETIKHTVDDQLGPAWDKIRRKQALLPNERYDVGLSQTLGDAQKNVVPGYDEMNKGIMDAMALEKMIKRRTTGSGGNQGLENLMLAGATMAGVPPKEAILMRILQSPEVASRLGIYAHMAGENPKAIAASMRAAIFALMAAHKPTPD